MKDPLFAEERRTYNRDWKNGRGHEYTLKNARQRHLNLKRRVLAIIGSSRCQWCGVDDARILEVNHLNGNGTKEYKSIGGRLYSQILAGKRPTLDLGVLCSPCNRLEWLYRKYPDLKGKCTISWSQ